METKVAINYLQEVELYVTKIVAEEFSEKIVFHDMEHIHHVISGVKRIAKSENVSDESKEIVLLAAWLYSLGFRNIQDSNKFKIPYDFFESCTLKSIDESKAYLDSIAYPKDKISQVVAVLSDASAKSTPQSILGKILADAITIEWSVKKSKKRINARYQEFLLLDIFQIGKKGYYQAMLEYLKNHTYFTTIGQTEFRPKKLELIKKIEKEQKGLTQQQEHLLSKELGITEQEVKKLKKSLKKASGRDDRGIQTMFRTTSRNHYTLYQMVDRKANILISVNAIILSLIIGRILGSMESFCIHSAPLLFLTISSVISITFAVLSILPSKTHGEFSEEEVRSKRGNLLFFGNYHNMTFKDYNWGMLQMLNDSDYLYTSMIRDLYYFGQQLQVKYMKIRIALVVFIVGIALTSILFVILSTLPGFHIGGAHG